MGRPKNAAEIETQFGTLKTEKLINGVTRFMIGEYASLEEAKTKLPKAKGMGFLDAFVTAYKDGVRLTNKQMEDLK